ncbi:signal peptidase I [Sedimentibacter sp. zth1]|uniref:signal peptidase I n=1 Tax=Sedimentibacter sp. zth1 TaxID=2816908 RepID=UPI001A92B07B|nr:signal peptidase I [Sedimentibacter sp. zth1]QSX06989.1 signal peptidase I [Sedimentibacter sp. zth1]
MKYFVKEWVVPALIALVIVLLLNAFVFQLVTVPTGSMISTIMPKDRLYVNKIMDVDSVEREDILVFKSKELDKLLVKRLIGLPGEKVDIKSNGDVYINDVKLYEPYAVPTTTPCREQTFIIPEDCFFFLGDNRPVSKDARYWNEPFINKSEVRGRAVFRFFPFNRIGRIE